MVAYVCDTKALLGSTTNTEAKVPCIVKQGKQTCNFCAPLEIFLSTCTLRAGGSVLREVCAHVPTLKQIRILAGGTLREKLIVKT